ncbi:MAG: bacteriochlorophyll 4-vinyl reductase, partial [Chloroflexia bacterium]|nr:bacteriochlorophyll 4-vinyl reductase [Chloroflexia bacterium]
MHTTHATAGVVRIGPNSIIQTVGALNEVYGAEAARAILGRIGHSALNEQLPTDMVDEHVFMALINALR